ncbi:MAG TPA: outer membrane beta-barrel protein [Geobacterales bacterium]|nr:outer membrane beta-barrel protein [Geobacterales bacterium]
MKGFPMRRALLLLTMLLTPLLAMAEGESSYLSLKGGAFLPNGTGASPDGRDNGLANLNTGYNGELAIGFLPAPYAAIEFATGFFHCEADLAEPLANRSVNVTAEGIPMTVTAKAIAHFDHLQLFAGAGAGYYFTILRAKTTNLNPPQQVLADEEFHASAPGYHLVAGGDIMLGKAVSIGAEYKWFNTRPEYNLRNSVWQPTADKVKWQFGGAQANLVLTFHFQ